MTGVESHGATDGASVTTLVGSREEDSQNDLGMDMDDGNDLPVRGRRATRRD